MPAMLAKWGGAWITLPLVFAGALRAAEVIGSLPNRVIMIVALLAGLAWAFGGKSRTRRLAELYVWLAFILPFGPLNIAAQSLAAQIGREQVTVYAAISIIHLLVVCVALWTLGAFQTADESEVSPLARRAAAICIIAAVIFWSGATTWPGMGLKEIAAHMRGHMWTSATFLLAGLLTAAGLLLLTMALREAGDRLASSFGLAAFLSGCVFWVIHLAFRLTVMPWAAREFLTTGVAPPWYEPWRLWSGLLFGLYSVLAYIAIASYGVALLRTRLLARWAAWASIVFGVSAAPLFGPPLLIHVIPWMLGILILQHHLPISVAQTELREMRAVHS